MRRRGVWASLVVVALLFPSEIALGQGAASHRVPRFGPGPCAVQVASGEKIDCGVLTVLEDRSRPSGRTIRLPVTIFRSRSGHPAPDPVLRMLGGPGVSSVATARSARDIPFVDDRDFIVLEQRGARHAEPSLECPGYERAVDSVALLGLGHDAAVPHVVAAARHCSARLRDAGIDIAAYTTAATAADIEDLREVLGYGRLNLYGVSYSTRIMLTVARDFPRSVRSMILDSPLPPGVPYDEMNVANLARSLDLVIDGCAVDPACARAYPQLRMELDSVASRADRAPGKLVVTAPPDSGRVVSVTGREVIGALWVGLSVPSSIGALPRAIDAAYRGDMREIRALAANLYGEYGYTWGLRLSVWCRDVTPFERRPAIAAQAGEDYPWLHGVESPGIRPEACDAWGVPPSPPVEGEAVRAAVPTIVFSGQYDPWTAAPWGRALVRTLPNALFYEVPGQSHAPLFHSRCAVAIAVDFVKNPATAPDAGCLARDPGLRFEIGGGG